MVDTVNKKRQTDEIRRCARDPIYFFNAYVRVQHPQKGTIPFKTFPFQDDCTKAFVEHRFVIVNKSRQLGLSTLGAAYAAWLLIFNKNKEIVVMATKLAVAQNFIKKVKFCIKNLPPWLVLPKIETDNERRLVFGKPSFSRIEAIPTSEDAGRSEALSLLIVDEAAHVDNFEELWKGLYPTLSCVVGGTKVLMDDGFHDIEDFCANRNVGDYFELSGRIFGKNGLEHLSHGYVSPESETLKLTTKHGLEIEVTHKHPLWVLNHHNGGSMVKAENIQIGDSLRVQYNMQMFSNDNRIEHSDVKEITPELAYLVGGWIAEGWITKDEYRTTVSNTDDDFRAAFINNKYIKQFVPAQNHKLTCYSKEFVQLFKALGVDVEWKCDTKRVPKKIWQSTKDVQRAFLRGYFDGDGCVSQMVGASSTSHKLLLDIQQLLLNMGIISQISEISQEKLQKLIGRFIGENKNPIQSVRRAWCINIPRTHSKKFLDNVGFNITRKRLKLEELVERYGCDDKQLLYIPLTDFFLGKLDVIVRESGKSFSWFSQHNVYLPTKTSKCKSVTMKTLKVFLALLLKEKLVSELNASFLHELVGGDYLWDAVVKIETSRNKTFDFTVPTTHSFLQNCILGSNTGGRALIISTPKGVGNWFHKLWVDAENKTNEFYPINLPWTVHPERDDAWFQEQASNMSQKAISQELLCDFLASGDTYFEASDIEWIGQIVRSPLHREGYDKNVWVWSEPMRDPGVKYIISADVGRGDGTDFSAFHIICTITGEVVAEFKGKIRPDLFAKLLLEYGRKYNNALICPERNTYGNHVIIELVNNRYSNIYFENQKGVFFGDYIPPEVISDAGFDTQRDSRKKIITKLEEVIRNKQIKIYSTRFWNELKTFVTMHDKPQALKNCNDDLILSLAIGVHLYDSSGVHSQFADQLNKAMLSGFGRTDNPFDTMAGTGNDVLPSATGMMPYMGTQQQQQQQLKLRRMASSMNDPRNFDWMWKK